jgi:hypothetical protein
LAKVEAGEEVDCEVVGTMWLSHGSYGLAFGVGDAETGGVIAISDQSVFFDVAGPGGIFTTSVVNLDAAFRFVTETDRVGLCASAEVRIQEQGLTE